LTLFPYTTLFRSTLEYVRSLEEQLKKTRAAFTVLERKQTRQERTIEQLVNQVNSRP